MPPTTPAARSAIDKLVAESNSLYTLPSVALEVLRLTENETVDVPALKQAIEGDPAMVVKLLKVVNSSLFGLSGEVGSLTQALALLGARPLKMLVLGFSLPDALLAEASAEQLNHFWRSSLTRALVARDLATEHFAASADGASAGGVSPDDAFIAGLLQDIGTLVLVARLGTPYAGLLDSAAEEGVPPSELERRSLGFTRTELSAALTINWRLPTAITEAIGRCAQDEPFTDSEASLAQPLRLADLLVRVVVDHRLDALPALLDEGAAYCGLTNNVVREMVASLEERVADLASAMAAPLGSSGDEGEDYQQAMIDAQARLALVSQSEVATPSADDDAVCEALLAECHELRLAMSQFLKGKPEAAAKLLRPEGAHLPADKTPNADQSPTIPEKERDRLLDALDKLARQTRASRHALSLALVQVDADLDDQPTDGRLRSVLAEARGLLGERRTARLTLGPHLFALLMPAVGRADAIAYVEEVDRLLADSSEPSPITLLAGVATIELPPNRFDPTKLLDAAEGCLSTARTSTTKRVRSIEVY